MFKYTLTGVSAYRFLVDTDTQSVIGVQNEKETKLLLLSHDMIV